MLETVKSWKCFTSIEKTNYDIKMVARKESLAPMWATLRKKIELEDHTHSTGRPSFFGMHSKSSHSRRRNDQERPRVTLCGTIL